MPAVIVIAVAIFLALDWIRPWSLNLFYGETF